MGRGKVELKKIENKISRQVTFSKRRTGLLKKAREISVLCDAHVALMVFSTKGKLCQYASDSSCMEKILDRYEQYANAERQLTAPDPDSFASCSLEHEKVKAELEKVEKNQRHYMGEELDSLSLKELQNVEHQLDNALKHIRSKRNHLMYESISELQKKDKALQDHNDVLLRKGKEQEQENENERAIVQQGQWDKQQHDLHSPSFFASRVLHSSDTRGSYESGSSVIEDEATRVQNKSNSSSTTMPAWMLNHIADQ